MIEHQGELNGAGLRFAIVASRYNDFITGKLVSGADEFLREHGVAADDIEVFWCPGALEIAALTAQVIRHGIEGRHFHGIVCIGCVIKGETDHYQFVAGESMKGVSALALEGKAAIGNAVLTVEKVEQAIERSGDKASNKGYEAAAAALLMADLYRQLAQR